MEIPKTIQEQKTGVGYRPEQRQWVCLCCGKTFSQQEVFPCDGHWYTAQAAAHLHQRQEHGDRFSLLLAEEPKLTQHQKDLLSLFRQGGTDGELAAAIGLAPATLRQQRFLFREKARAARRYLALYELAFEERDAAFSARPVPQQDRESPVLSPHAAATMVDERYCITKEEEQRILQNLLLSQVPLRLKHLPPKEKKKVVILRRVAQEFSAGRSYSEPEVDGILKAIYPEDHATLRRYLIEYGFLGRTRDCKTYWKKSSDEQNL